MHEPTPKLKQPAIVEAVCEFRFSTAQSYSIVPGAMRERLRTSFPHLELLPPAALMSGFADEVMAASMPVPFHRFKRDNPNAMVQTGPKLLTVNILPTYPSFEVYRELILSALEAYRSVAQPGPAVRLGLRYINHIPMSDEGGSIKDYLNIEFAYPKSLPGASQELSGRILFPHAPVGTLSLAVAFPSRVGQGSLGALLDLDFFQAEPERISLDSFDQWLNEAHAIIYKAFTAMVAYPVMKRMRGE